MTDRLHLLSWNIHGVPTQLGCGRRPRIDRIAGEINRRQPEIVLLQELWCRRTLRRLREKMEYAYAAVDGPDGGCIRRSGLAAFVHRDSPWWLEGQSFTAFAEHATAWKFWEGDGVSGKGVHALQFVADRMRVTILNTPLQAEYDGVQ